MARDLSGESEFGLGEMPILDAEGRPQTGNAGVAALAAGGIPALTDADAVKAGAVGQEATPISAAQLGHELREIYAKGEGDLGPGGVANASFRP